VDHGTIQKDFQDFLDLNKDGKVDMEDGKLVYNKVLKVLEFNLPAGGGFAAGFLGGLRTG
jgi:FUN14 family